MNILVPMDLTSVSANGLRYALSRFPDATITALHVMSGILEFNQAYNIQPGVRHDIQSANNLESLICDHLELKKLPDRVKIEIYYGEPTNVISKYVKDHDFDAVVAGSRDKYDLFDKNFGTTSLGIVKKVKIPVYIVPPYGAYKKYERIMVATDELISDPELIMAIKEWNDSNAMVKFIHVRQNDDEPFEKTKEALLETLFEQYQPPFSYEIEQVDGKGVVDSLLANAYNYKADLLVVIARNASFIQSLIFKSVSKEIIIKSAIPVLFLHNEQNK